jgi:tetratricopeptide (TPR) repeat protein
MHDLALAGILPALQTPGLQAAPQIAEEESLHVEDVDLSDLDIVDVGYSGLTSSISDVGGQARELGTDVSGIELLEIERTGQDLPVMESRVTDSDLRITHDAIPTGSDSAPRETATSVADESAQPAEGAIELTSALSHESLKSIAQSDAELLALLKVDPSDFALRRRLGEVLVEDGKRTQGLAELERAMSGFEDQGAIADAISVAEEILRLEPNSIRYHQKRVEYAFRNNDQSLLIESYLELADALFRTSQLSKASVVYERVLELDPANARANYAVAALLAGTKDVGAGGAVAGTEAGAPGSSHAGEAPVGPGSAEPHDASFVNLGDMVRADDAPRSTRMVVEDEAPSGDEEADFAEMLEKFKRSLAENVDDEDFESHYDLGIAFREMGLLDEAIAQFQRALRGTRRRVRTLEALGQCFVERSQFQVAANVLERALNEAEGGDENLVGVLYLLGYACEAMQKYSDALNYYQRLFMVDIQFRDVTTRIAALEKMVT